MKRFLAIYIGTTTALEKARWNEMPEEARRAREEAGMNGWIDWGRRNAAVIVDQGSPLGKTKRASPEGIADIKNAMTGYVIVEAETDEAAAELFRNHPHFSLFPGDSVEIMECLPLPGM